MDDAFEAAHHCALIALGRTTHQNLHPRRLQDDPRKRYRHHYGHVRPKRGPQVQNRVRQTEGDETVHVPLEPATVRVIKRVLHLGDEQIDDDQRKTEERYHVSHLLLAGSEHLHQSDAQRREERGEAGLHAELEREHVPEYIPLDFLQFVEGRREFLQRLRLGNGCFFLYIGEEPRET